MKYIALMFVLVVVMTGCKPEVEPLPPVPEEKGEIVINLGDSYEQVFDKLGKPNIDSASQSSRVLIYDKFEIKLQSNAVVEVFDHRISE